MSIVKRKRYCIETRTGSLVLGERTLVMGILNVTPDSFSDAGRHGSLNTAVQHAMDMIVAGADVIDVGGESTRPGAEPVPLDVEIERTLPVVQAIRKSSDIPISIDTTKAEVARQALEAGADIINDVSALRFDPAMVHVAQSFRAPVILMHMKGTPRTMQQNPVYASLFSEIIMYLEERIQFATGHGIPRDQIIVDPGIGFGKTVLQNLKLVRNLEAFQCLDRPILLGASRKSFIGSILHLPAEEREWGNAVVHAVGIASGTHMIRVHDVEGARQVAHMADAICMDEHLF